MCLAIPGEILEITNDDPLARSGKVSFGGIIKEVNLSLVPDSDVGDYVIVHAGFAISILDVADAQKVFEYLSEIEDIEQARENPR
jgi:hydrogenase expression/formation protein HypC